MSKEKYRISISFPLFIPLVLCRSQY